MHAAQWKSPSNRIRGLVQAGQIHASLPGDDSFGTAGRLREKGEGVLAEIRAFRDRFEYALPPRAVGAIDDFVATAGGLLNFGATGVGAGPELRAQSVSSALVLLSDFETEMSFMLSDVQWPIRALAERAFTHLQRLIVVDPDVRRKWKTAFKDGGEVACEKLGAIHLLLHGIFAFKVDAAGGRTDLVFQTPAGDLSKEQRFVDGIVLTEWKKAESGDEVAVKFAEARRQAKQYARGALAGVELTAYRYAIVVSLRQVTEPDDLREDGVEYRDVNIAVDPLPPSKAARLRQ
jgi:hypothetical protein